MQVDKQLRIVSEREREKKKRRRSINGQKKKMFFFFLGRDNIVSNKVTKEDIRRHI